MLVVVLPLVVLWWMVSDVFTADPSTPEIPDEALERLLADITDGSYTKMRIDKRTY